MRLWHQALILLLPRQQLLGQHRECCALRGQGWGRKHSVVDYVFTHIPEKLVAYHLVVMDEMERRGYKPDKVWKNGCYRGKKIGVQEDWCDDNIMKMWYEAGKTSPIYMEHNSDYLAECRSNLKEKGIDV